METTTTIINRAEELALLEKELRNTNLVLQKTRRKYLALKRAVAVVCTSLYWVISFPSLFYVYFIWSTLGVWATVGRMMATLVVSLFFYYLHRYLKKKGLFISLAEE